MTVIVDCVPQGLKSGDVLVRFDDIPTREQMLDYEVSSSWWACWISNSYLQKLAARYFAWKVNRKCARYVKHLANRAVMQYHGLAR